MKIAIIDFDNCLFITDGALYRAYSDAFLINGYKLDLLDWNKYFGYPIDYLFDKYCLSLKDRKAISLYKKENYNKHFNCIRINDVMYSELKEYDYFIICSMTDKYTIESIIAHFESLDFFSMKYSIVGKESVNNLISKRDIYLEVKKKTDKLYFDFDLDIYDDLKNNLVEAKDVFGEYSNYYQVYQSEIIQI